MSYNHFMVDLETTGTNPEHNAIIQIAGVAFDFESQDINPKMFDRCLLMPETRFWSEDTREWWGSQPEHVINGIWNRMEPPPRVLTDFAAWVREMAGDEPPILWAKPIHFEQPFLASYYRSFGLMTPFHYRYCEDLNSWCRARGLPNLAQEIDVVGDAHNALHDVLHQIQVLFTLLERTTVIDPASLQEGVVLKAPNGQEIKNDKAA